MRLRRTLTTRNPLPRKFEFALWTHEMVRELIRMRFDVHLSEASMGRLVCKLGLSPQRPLEHAYQRDPIPTQTRLRQEYPAIEQAVKLARAQIIFADEANIRSDYHSHATWAPVGQTLLVARTGARFTSSQPF